MEVKLALALVKELLAPEYLSAPQEMVFEAAWAGRSYRELAKAAGYDHNYLKGIGAQMWRMLSKATKQKVTKTNFRQVVAPLATTVAELRSATAPTPIDWGEATLGTRGYANDFPVVYGRESESAQLYEWIAIDRCRLVTILGLGGIGKTTMAIEVVQKLQHTVHTTDRFSTQAIDPTALPPTGKQLSCIIWRSLLNAPPLQELLPNIIQTAIAATVNADRQVADAGAEHSAQTNKFHVDCLPDTVAGQIKLLLAIFQQHRCLIILDNCESIFQSGAQVGTYRPGYADYGELFDLLGRTNHQSCLLLTSREKPMEIAQLEGANAKVRTMTLMELAPAAGQQIFTDCGCLPIDPSEWSEIDRYYGGNPLAFQLIAAAVKEVADGDLSEIFPYLQSHQLSVADIQILLQQQWERLTSAEQQVMYWLAIARAPLSIDEFEAVLHPDWHRQVDGNELMFFQVGFATALQSCLLTVLQFLRRRSIIVELPRQIDRDKRYWSLQPSVMGYVTSNFIDRICTEIETQQPCLLNTHPIVQASGTEYIRQAQLRTIVQPALIRLELSIGNPHQIGVHLRQILDRWQCSRPIQPGYLAANILNVLIQLQLDLTDLDCSELVIEHWHLLLTNYQTTQ